MNMKDFYEGLSPEQKTRFESCTDEASIVAFAKEEKLALPEKFLEYIAGGSFIGGPVSAENASEDNLVCPRCGNNDPNKITPIFPITARCEVCGEIFYLGF